jgi:hypothetical protein
MSRGGSAVRCRKRPVRASQEPKGTLMFATSSSRHRTCSLVSQAFSVAAPRQSRIGIAVETLALFIRFLLTTTPPMPEPAARAARAQVGAPNDNFVTALGRRLSQGRKLRQEITDDVDSVIEIGLAEGG